MVKQAAHDSSDECSIHSGLKREIIFFTLYYFDIKNSFNPSAGIGRQGDLKLRWGNIVNVQVVSRISIIIYYFFLIYCIPRIKPLKDDK